MEAILPLDLDRVYSIVKQNEDVMTYIEKAMKEQISYENESSIIYVSLHENLPEFCDASGYFNGDHFGLAGQIINHIQSQEGYQWLMA